MENALTIAVQAAAETARLAETASTNAQAATLREASGTWSILADHILRGVPLRETWVAQRALMADMTAARAGDLAPRPWSDELIAALYQRSA